MLRRRAAAVALLALAALAAGADAARGQGRCKAIPGCAACEVVEKGGEAHVRTKVVCTACAGVEYELKAKGKRCGESTG